MFESNFVVRLQVQKQGKLNKNDLSIVDTWENLGFLLN